MRVTGRKRIREECAEPAAIDDPLDGFLLHPVADDDADASLQRPSGSFHLQVMSKVYRTIQCFGTAENYLSLNY